MGSEIMQVSDEKEFDGLIEKADTPVIVDFWAPWCGPCQMQGKVLDEFAANNSDKAVVVKINVDDAPALAQRFGVQSIPTVLIFKGGQLVEQKVGLMPIEEIENKI